MSPITPLPKYHPAIAVTTPNPDTTANWCRMLQSLLPEWHVAPIDQIADPTTILYAIVWQPRSGSLKPLVNLKAILSIGAGIDHVLADKQRPPNIPIIRTISPELTQRMREYVALHVLRYHRAQPRFEAAQQRQQWLRYPLPIAAKRRVGIMGLGNFGAAAAQTLIDLGFQVAGWARAPKNLNGVISYAGNEALPAFLAKTEILVCLLPLTPETAGILNATLFRQLPRGAALINAARGGHLIEADLLDALEQGALDAATLDVFNTEPLPPDHPFWLHPNITITPHIGSIVDAPTGAVIMADNIRAFERGNPIPMLTDLSRGY